MEAIRQRIEGNNAAAIMSDIWDHSVVIRIKGEENGG